MKVIFLDIDGVLNSEATHNPKKLPYVIDRVLLRRLKSVLQQTKARIVLTSTWRYDPIGRYAAKYYGLRYMGCTPDLSHRPRCEEIRRWLERHPKVTRYAVLDDDDDELDGLPLFQPSASEGLTRKMAAAMVRYLNGKTERDMRRGLVVRALEDARAILLRHPG